MDRPHPPFCRLQGSRERLCWPLLGPTGRPRWALMMPSASPAFSPFSVRVVGGFLARTRNGATEANPIFISEYTPSPISTWKLLSIFTNNSRLCESMPDYRSKSIREPKRGSPIFTRLCTWTTYRYFLLFIGNYSRLDSWKRFFDLALGKRTFRDGNANERISCLRTRNMTVKPDFSLSE